MSAPVVTRVRRSAFGTGMALAIVGLVTMSAAYACTAQATLKASPPFGQAGTSVSPRR